MLLIYFTVNTLRSKKVPHLLLLSLLQVTTHPTITPALWCSLFKAHFKKGEEHTEFREGYPDLSPNPAAQSEWTGRCVLAPFSSHPKTQLLLTYVHPQIHPWGRWGRRSLSRGRRCGMCPCSHTLAEQKRDKDLSPRSSGQGSVHNSQLFALHFYTQFAC